jgi:hypothetical protein
MWWSEKLYDLVEAVEGAVTEILHLLRRAFSPLRRTFSPTLFRIRWNFWVMEWRLNRGLHVDEHGPYLAWCDPEAVRLLCPDDLDCYEQERERLYSRAHYADLGDYALGDPKYYRRAERGWLSFSAKQKTRRQLRWEKQKKKCFSMQ